MTFSVRLSLWIVLALACLAVAFISAQRVYSVQVSVRVIENTRAEGWPDGQSLVLRAGHLDFNRNIPVVQRPMLWLLRPSYWGGRP